MRHNQEDYCARDDESQREAEQRPAGEAVRRFLLTWARRHERAGYASAVSLARSAAPRPADGHRVAWQRYIPLSPKIRPRERGERVPASAVKTQASTALHLFCERLDLFLLFGRWTRLPDPSLDEFLAVFRRAKIFGDWLALLDRDNLIMQAGKATCFYVAQRVLLLCQILAQPPAILFATRADSNR